MVTVARYDAAGRFLIRTRKDALGAAVATLRFIACCPQAYHTAGPEAVARNMEIAARDLLAALDQVTA